MTRRRLDAVLGALDTAGIRRLAGELLTATLAGKRTRRVCLPSGLVVRDSVGPPAVT